MTKAVDLFDASDGLLVFKLRVIYQKVNFRKKCQSEANSGKLSFMSKFLEI